MDHVILVDTEDRPIGTMEKMEAHRQGALHRAFSVLLFNRKGEMLLQKRAESKYHSGGLWTNACCSHPLPGESLDDATQRKMKQEMGISPPLTFLFKFIYSVKLGVGLIEHEFDHVFVGRFDGEPVVNSEEVADWKYVDLTSLKIDITRNPENYTEWFKLIMRYPDHEEN